MKKHAIILFLSVLAAMINAQNIYNTMLYNSLSENNFKDAEHWIKKGADVNYIDSTGLSALHIAARDGKIETVKFLISYGAKVDILDSGGRTALMYAAFKGNLRICHSLIQGGAMNSTKDNYGNEAASYAKNFGYIRVANYLENLSSYSEDVTFDECFELAKKMFIKRNFNNAKDKAKEALERAKIELETEHSYHEKIEKLILKINNEIQDYNYLENHSIIIAKATPLNKLSEKVSDMLKYGDYTVMLKKMFELSIETNEYFHAEVLVKALLEMKERKNEIDEDYVILLMQQGIVYLNIQEYFKSEEALNKALSYNKINENNELLNIQIILSLSQLFQFTGNLEKAHKRIQECFDRIESLNSPNKNYLQFCALNIIGQFYSRKGHNELALNSFIHAFSIASNYENYKNHNYTMTVLNLGRQYIINREISNAIKILENLKAQLEQNDIYNLTYCNCLNYIGTCYIINNNYTEAMYFFEYSTQLRKNLGLDDESCLLPLAFLNSECNKVHKADSLYQLTMSKTKADVKNKFSYFSENERNLYITTKNNSIDQIKSYTYKFMNRHPVKGILAYDNELFTKGLLLNTSLQIQNAVLQSGDTTLIETWENLRGLKRQINILQSKPLGQQGDLEIMEVQANSLDKVLTQKSQLYKQSQEDMQVKWTDVQNNLKPDEAAIEFVNFRYFNKELTDSMLNYALVLKKGSKYPELIPLFEDKQLDSLFVSSSSDINQLYKYRVTKLRKDTLEQVLNYGAELYNLVWKPLETSLKDIKTVYYAPSGKLNQVAFAAIPVDSTVLLSDKYNLHQVTSTRQLIKSNNVPTVKQNAVLFGGIQYELDKKQLAQVQTTTEMDYRSAFVNDSTQRSNSFNYLKGTAEEVEGISEQFKNKKLPGQLYTGITASEAAFKKLNGTNTNIIHIATHGFFLPIEETKREDMRFMNFDNERRNVIVKNPLLRSGLVMAGANHAWRGDSIPDNWEDGILTAHEISQLNLTNTDLVVLSACETGLGDDGGSEGVFGLQRAFKMAGVQTIIMSLWRVDDKVTSEFMQLFYKYWLGGLSKQEAFRKVQAEIKQLYPNPYYWAAFVMVD